MERRKFTREFKLEAVRLIKQRGVSYAQASQDLSVHQSQLRSWVKAFADDPQHAFPGQGQMKPEQIEIARLKREVIKLKAERDIFSRRVVGWSMSAEMTAQFVTDALVMAIWRRGKPDALLHHSDRGSQGGLKRSSQQPDQGGCDEDSESTSI